MSSCRAQHAASGDELEKLQWRFAATLTASTNHTLGHDIKIAEQYLATIPKAIHDLNSRAIEQDPSDPLYQLYQDLIQQTEKSRYLLIEHLELLYQEKVRKEDEERSAIEAEANKNAQGSGLAERILLGRGRLSLSPSRRSPSTGPSSSDTLEAASVSASSF